jgi:hypothetical protein
MTRPDNTDRSDEEQTVGHMVIFRGSDGKPGYHQAEELGEAIQFVEHLRNDDGVEHARIFRMDEVGFEFRPYFRVEVGAAAGAPELVVVPQPSAWPPAPAEAAAPALEELVAVEAPVLEALTAIVGEPAGEPWPDHDAAPAPLVGADDSGSTNGSRRGLFGR